MINFTPPPLTPHGPPTVTVVPQMESTAGLPHGLEAGPVIWGSGNNHHFPHNIFFSRVSLWAPSRATPTFIPLNISHRVLSFALSDNQREEIIAPPIQKWQKWKKEDRQGFSDRLQNARMINHSNTQVSGPVQFEKHCLSTKIHYV